MDDLRVRDTDLILVRYLGLLQLDPEGIARVRTTLDHAHRLQGMGRELRLGAWGDPPKKGQAVLRIESVAPDGDGVSLKVRLHRYCWEGEGYWRSGRGASCPQRLAVPGSISRVFPVSSLRRQSALRL